MVADIELTRESKHALCFLCIFKGDSAKGSHDITTTVHKLGGGAGWLPGWGPDESAGEALATAGVGEVLPLFGRPLARTGERVEDRQESKGQARKSRTGEKFEDRQESQGQARKSRTGEKVEDRRESRGQARKSRTGRKVEDRYES